MLEYKGHASGIVAAAISPDGRRFVTASGDATAKLWMSKLVANWRIPSNQNFWKGSRWAFLRTAVEFPASFHTRRIDALLKNYSASKSKDHFDRSNVSTTEQATPKAKQVIVIWNTDPQSLIGENPYGLPNAQLIANSQKVEIFNSGDWDFSHQASPESRRIITTFKGTAKVWNADTNRELVKLEGHKAEVTCVAISDNGRWIVTGSADKTAKVWEARIGRELVTLPGNGEEVYCVAISKDCLRILTGSATGRVWDLESGRELLNLKGHIGPVSAVAFSPDGERVITGGCDNIAKVWNALTGREILTLEGHSSGLSSAAFSPDGKRILTGSRDNTAKVWDAATGRELLTFNVLQGRSDPPTPAAVADSKTGAGGNDSSTKTWVAASLDEVEQRTKEDGFRKLLDDLHSAIDNENWEKANTHLAAAEKLSGENDRMELNQARFDILMGEKNYSAACKLAEQMSDGHRDDADLQNGLARDIANVNGIGPSYLETAENLATRANDTAKGKDPDILDTLARVLFVRGKRTRPFRSRKKRLKSRWAKKRRAFKSPSTAIGRVCCRSWIKTSAIRTVPGMRMDLLERQEYPDIGFPSDAYVARGARVRRGRKIGDPSTPLWSLRLPPLCSG